VKSINLGLSLGEGGGSLGRVVGWHLLLGVFPQTEGSTNVNVEGPDDSKLGDLDAVV